MHINLRRNIKAQNITAIFNFILSDQAGSSEAVTWKRTIEALMKSIAIINLILSTLERYPFITFICFLPGCYAVSYNLCRWRIVLEEIGFGPSIGEILRADEVKVQRRATECLKKTRGTTTDIFPIYLLIKYIVFIINRR
jgi:hypothetical protein